MISRMFNHFHELARFLELTRITKEDIVFVGYDPLSKCWCLIYAERR